MATKCYAMVRGSAIRVTGLGQKGQIPNPIPYATSKSVVNVTVNEVTEAGANELLRTEEDEARLLLARATQTIRHTIDIDFLRVDPGVLSLVAGVPLLWSDYEGFGDGPFGEMPFGLEGGIGDVVGFDSTTRIPATSFALEVWSKLAGQKCADGSPMYGYTLFPFLKGGRLSGFTFANGLVSFNLRGAQTRKASRWGVGPWDLEGQHERLLQVVSRNSSFQSFITPAVPPVEVCGVQETTDIIDNEDATYEGEGETTTVERNLAPNPSFEVDLSRWNGPFNSTAARSNAVSFAGSWSLALTCTAAGASLLIQSSNQPAQAIPAMAGVTYTLRARSRAQQTARPFRAEIIFRTSTGAEITTAAAAYGQNTVDGWTLYTITAVAPANTAYISVGLRIGGGSTQVEETHYFDAVMVHEGGAAAYDYLDGDLPDTATVRHAWVGTPHASTSTRITTEFTDPDALNIIDGGSATDSGPWIIEGGRAV